MPEQTTFTNDATDTENRLDDADDYFFNLSCEKTDFEETID